MTCRHPGIRTAVKFDSYEHRCTFCGVEFVPVSRAVAAETLAASLKTRLELATAARDEEE